MITLQNLITAKIKELNLRVYLEQAPKGTTYPYVTFTISNTNEAENREDFNIEVDVWDNKTDTTAIDTIADNIDKKLNRLNTSSDNLSTTIYRTNRLMVEDTNPQIRHRQLRFIAKTYFL